MGHIFISHSSEDKKYVRALETELGKRGFEVWVDDQAIRYGTHWMNEIEQAIIGCAALIVVMTPNSAHPESWVREEIITAKKNDKPIFPLLLDGTGLFGLGSLHHTDVTNGQMPPERFYKELSQVMVPKSSPSQSVKIANSRQLYSRELYKQGEAFQGMLKLKEALDAFTKAIVLDPDYAEAFRSKSIIYFLQGDLEQALKNINEAIRLAPNYVDGYMTRAKICRLKGDARQALADYDKALHFDPNFVDAYCARGYLYFWRGHDGQALVDFNKAIRVDPKYASGHYGRGLVYEKRNEYEQAQADFTKAIRLESDSEMRNRYKSALKRVGGKYKRFGIFK